MASITSESPILEQEICINCGFCCDGTLFENAVLQVGERGQLPKEIAKKYHRNEDKEYFALPCSYFHGKCTIYDQKKPSVCSSFRCQLLKDYSGSRISQPDAIDKVANTSKFKAEIYQLYSQIFGKDYTLSFRELLIELGTYIDGMSQDDPQKSSIEFLRIKCTIFETLLIKNFKSVKNFKNLIDTSMYTP